jgi:hypothetical protein
MELTPLRITQQRQGEAFFTAIARSSQDEQPNRTTEFGRFRAQSVSSLGQYSRRT